MLELREDFKEAADVKEEESEEEFEEGEEKKDVIELRNLFAEFNAEKEENENKLEIKQEIQKLIKKDPSDRVINGVKENMRTTEEEMKLKLRNIKQKKIIVSSHKLWKAENESFSLSKDVVGLLRFLNSSKNWNSLIEEKIIKSLEEFDTINAATIDRNVISKGLLLLLYIFT